MSGYDRFTLPALVFDLFLNNLKSTIRQIKIINDPQRASNAVVIHLKQNSKVAIAIYFLYSVNLLNIKKG